MIVALAYLADLEEWIGQGWHASQLIARHPVQRAYGRVYVWRDA